MVEQWDTEEFRADTAFADGDFVNWDQRSWSPPVLTRTWFHTGAFDEARRRHASSTLSEYWTEPALRGARPGGRRAAMRLPDTVLPDGLDAVRGAGGLPGAQGPARCASRSTPTTAPPAAANPYTVTEQNFTVRLPAAPGTRTGTRSSTCHPRESAGVPLRARRGRPAGHPRADPGDRRVRQRRCGPCPSATRAAPAIRRRSRPSPLPSRRCWPTTRAACTCGAPSTPTPTPSTTPPPGRTPTAPRCSASGRLGRDHRRRPARPSAPGSPACSPSTSSTARRRLADRLERRPRHPLRAVPASDVDGTGTPAAAPTRRVIARHRILYRSDDLTALLRPGQLEPRALPGESYQAALTARHAAGDLRAAACPPPTLAEGGYVQLPGETGWWIPSGRVYYSPGDTDTPAQELAAALAHFFLPLPRRRPVRRDHPGRLRRLRACCPRPVTDPVGNVTVGRQRLPGAAARHGHRPERQPGRRRLRRPRPGGRHRGHGQGERAARRLPDRLHRRPGRSDAGWRTSADPLADPAAILGNATTRILYDLGAYQRTRTHGAARRRPPSTPWPAKPTSPTWPRRRRTRRPADHAVPVPLRLRRRLRPGDPAQGPGGARPGHRRRPAVSPRWVGSGWTIFDNKGRPVRQYEPFFSATSAFEFAAADRRQHGPVLRPAGPRGRRRCTPTARWEKTAFDPWRSRQWDGNDTVLIADPRTDPDVGDYFPRLLGSRGRSPPGTTCASAARTAPRRKSGPRSRTRRSKAAAHAGTPTVTHFDALGRTCLTVADNGGGGRYPARTAWTPRASRWPCSTRWAGARRSTSCRSRRPGGGVATSPGTDMAGNPLYRVSADGGARRSLAQRRRAADPHLGRTRARVPARLRPGAAADAPLRQHRRRARDPPRADRLRRRPAGGEPLRPPVPPLRHGRVRREQPVRLQGQPAAGGPAARRGLPRARPTGRRWPASPTAADLDAARPRRLLRPGRRPTASRSTALRRARTARSRRSRRTAPRCCPTCCARLRRSRPAPPGRRLAAAGRRAGRAARPRHRRPARRHRHRLQRPRPADLGRLGNGTVTAYSYDPQTFRLTHLTTTRPASFAAGQRTRPGPVLLLRPGRQHHPHPRRRRHPERHLLPQPAGRAVGQLHLRPAVPAARRDRPRAPRPDRRRAARRRSRSPTTTRSAPASRSPATATRWAPTPRPTPTTRSGNLHVDGATR